ncbi:hypothetical protein FRC16_004888, partial [Serendipita sp. 398]
TKTANTPTHIVLSGEQRKKEWKLINVYLILPKVILTTLQEAWISIHFQHVAENKEKAIDASVEYNQHKDPHEYHNNMEKAVKNSKKAEDLFQAEEETRKV